MATSLLALPGRILDRVRRATVEQSWGVRRAIQLLEPDERRKFWLISALQAGVGLLDTLGILLVGLVAAVLASGLDPGRTPTYVTGFLDGTGLSQVTLIQASAIIGLSAVALMIVKGLLGVAFTRGQYRFLAHQQSEVSRRLTTSFLAQPLLFVQQWTTAQAQYALTRGVGLGVVIALGGASSAMAEMALFSAVALVLLVIDPMLSVLVAGVFLMSGVVIVLMYGRRTSRDAALFRDSTVGLDTIVADALATYRETVVLNRRQAFVQRFVEGAKSNADANADMQYVLEVPKYLLEALLVIVAFALAVSQVATKDFPAAAGTVALFLTAGFRVIPSMLRLQAAVTNIRRGVEGALPTFELADALSSQSTRAWAGSYFDGTDPHQRASGHEELEFEATVILDGVSFTYPGASRPALLDVSFTATPGMSVALVGSTGAGKSTLADIVLGVLSPDRGIVLISGQGPEAAVYRWPGAIACVPQSVALVDGTVRDNVALGLAPEDVSDDEIWSALRQAHLDTFLQDSRNGLATIVGERGVRLSGGQRQRLGIARALLTRPRVLVMDEATSALDAETEAAITGTLQGLEGRVTTITVAHRLATIRFADLVLFMRDGVVVARGTFEEVRAQEPDFARQAKLLGL